MTVRRNTNQIGRSVINNLITNETKEMCGTTDSSFQSSNTFNNTGVDHS